MAVERLNQQRIALTVPADDTVGKIGLAMILSKPIEVDKASPKLIGDLADQPKLAWRYLDRGTCGAAANFRVSSDD